MKNQPKTNLAIRSGLAVALASAFAIAIWSPVQAQDTEPGKAKMDADMMERCQTMMSQKQQMTEDMKAQDAELTKHVSEMNSATKDKKVDVMAAVITHMVEQRIAMHARHATMEEEMMDHMMRHMQMSKESMAHCPMMKSMSDHSADAHTGHDAAPK